MATNPNLPESLKGSPADPSVQLQRSLRAQNATTEAELRTCDACRRRRVKCDRGQPRCTRCAELNVECTRQDVLMRRGPPKKEEREAFAAAGIVYQTERDRRRERKQAKERERTRRATGDGMEQAPGLSIAGPSNTSGGLNHTNGARAGSASPTRNGGIKATAASSLPMEMSTNSSMGSSSMSLRSESISSTSIKPEALPLSQLTFRHSGADAQRLYHVSTYDDQAPTYTPPAFDSSAFAPTEGIGGGATGSLQDVSTAMHESLWTQVATDSEALGPIYNHRAGRKPEHLIAPPTPDIEGMYAASVSGLSAGGDASGLVGGRSDLLDPSQQPLPVCESLPLPPIESVLWSMHAPDEPVPQIGLKQGSSGVNGHGLKTTHTGSYSSPSVGVSISLPMISSSMQYVPSRSIPGALDPSWTASNENSSATAAYDWNQQQHSQEPSISNLMSTGALPYSLPPMQTASLALSPTSTAIGSDPFRHSPHHVPASSGPSSVSSDRTAIHSVGSMNGGRVAATPASTRGPKSSPDDERLHVQIADRTLLYDLLNQVNSGVSGAKLTYGSFDSQILFGRSFANLESMLSNPSDPLTLYFDEDGYLQVTRPDDWFGSLLECQRPDWAARGPAGSVLRPQWDKFTKLEYQRGVLYPQMTFRESEFDDLRLIASRILLHPAASRLIEEYIEFNHQISLVLHAQELRELQKHLCAIARGEPTAWTPVQIRQRQAIVLAAIHQGSWTYPGLDIFTSSGASVRVVTWELGMSAFKLAYALCCPRNIEHDAEECTSDLSTAFHLWAAWGTLQELGRIVRYGCTFTPILRRLGALAPQRFKQEISANHRECLNRQAWRFVQAKNLILLWTQIQWPDHTLIQNKELVGLPFPSPMPGELLEDGGDVPFDAFLFRSDKIKLLAIMNDVLCSPIATAARKADPSKKHLVEQLANRFIQDLQNWASSAACLRPSAIASFSLLPEGIQGAKRWKIGTICGYSNMIITLLRAALRNVQSNIKVRLSFTQATLAALDATAPPKPDRLTLFYDSLVWAAKA